MRITVRKKLILGFSAMIILVVIVGKIALVNFNKINDAYQIASRQSQVASYSSQIEIAILECRRAEKNFWLRGNDRYIEKLKEQTERIKRNTILIREMKPGKDLNNQIDKISTLADEYYKEFLKSANLLKSGRREEILTEDNRFVIVSRRLQNLVPQISKEISRRMGRDIEMAERTKIRLSRIIIIGIIFAVVIAFLTALLISQSIIKPIDKLMYAMKKVEGGDLQERVDAKSRDEFGVLGNYFNEMLDKLEEGQQQVANAEKLASIGRLAAGVAHEINNPLTGVLTSGHLLLKKTPVDAQQREDLEIIVKETTRCRSIIKGLLDFARQTKPEIKPSSINKIIEESLSLVKNQASSHNIKIVKNLVQSLPLIPVDANQIQQVFINIILNAQEAMPNGGFLTISSNICDTSVEIKFIDTGCGISKKNIDKLFDPFFTTKEESKGTGLGLAVSYGIIENHQGSIDIESKLGNGTTVIVKLPALERSG